MSEEEGKKKKGGGFFQSVKEFVYGVAAHDSARFAMKSRASMEHLFILITMGDLLGVPILPPYYSLRIPSLRGSADFHLEAADAAGKGHD